MYICRLHGSYAWPDIGLSAPGPISFQQAVTAHLSAHPHCVEFVNRHILKGNTTPCESHDATERPFDASKRQGKGVHEHLLQWWCALFRFVYSLCYHPSLKCSFLICVQCEALCAFTVVRAVRSTGLRVIPLIHGKMHMMTLCATYTAPFGFGSPDFGKRPDIVALKI